MATAHGADNSILEGNMAAADDLLVIVAEDEGDVFCLVGEDGAPATYRRDDPEIAEFIRQAAEVYGAQARAISLDEFKALPSGD
jgi:hypothetical protein